VGALPEGLTPGCFLLAVGTIEPRKNYPRLLRAYRRLKDRGLSLPLVVAGRVGWAYGRAVDDLPEEPGVRLLGHVDAGTLRAGQPQRSRPGARGCLHVAGRRSRHVRHPGQPVGAVRWAPKRRPYDRGGVSELHPVRVLAHLSEEAQPLLHGLRERPWLEVEAS